MSGEQIHYKELEQEALRGVVRTVLTRVEKNGLPGDHHFFIAFDTQADGVNLSKRLKEQYPEEMTIVLQHQFWDLKVHETFFEIKLSFNEIPERLVVPYTAIKVFFDPSVPYGLQLGTVEITADEALQEIVSDSGENKGKIAPVLAVTESSPILSSTEEKEENTITITPEEKADESNSKSDSDEEQEDKEDAQKSADIVSLDQFRKK